MEFEIKSSEKLDIGFKELWDYRELLYFFAWRDVKVKYKQTLLGFFWVIFQPLFMTFIFTFFIGKMVSNFTNISIPYPLFALSGMLLWGMFGGGMINATNSIVTNSSIIKKIYCPRLIIPISAVLVSIIDFFVSLILLFGLIFYYHEPLTIKAFVFLPLSLILTILTALGMGTFLSALNIKYRDVRYVIPFIIQALMFFTPVIYPVNISGNKIMFYLMKFNPMSGALELIRGIFLSYSIDYFTVFISFLISVLIFILGLIYFKKTEQIFADIV